MVLVQGLSSRPPQPRLPRKLSPLFPLRTSRGSSQGGEDGGTHHSDQAPRRPSLPASCRPTEARLLVISTVFLTVLLLVLTLTVLGRVVLFLFLLFPPPRPAPGALPLRRVLPSLPSEQPQNRGRRSSSAGSQRGAPSDQRLLGSAIGSATTSMVTCRGTDTPGHGGRAQSQTLGRETTSLGSEGEVQPFP